MNRPADRYRGERQDDGNVDLFAITEQFIGGARMAVGSPDSCEAIIRQYESIGIDRFMGVVQFSNITHEQSMNTIRLMGEEVIPRFRNSAPAEAEMAG
jgi:hypothetical protein